MSNQAKKARVFVTRGGDEIPYTFVSQSDLVPLQSSLDNDKPLPPVEEVDTADGKRKIPNEAHPAYLEALSQFEAERNLYIIACVVELGVNLDITEEQLADITMYQNKLARLLPDVAGRSRTKDFNIYNYVKSICPSIEEQGQLHNAILDITTPTSEQVQKQIDTFRPDVSGTANNVDSGTAIGDTVAIG